jgi:signal peptidase I
MIDSLCLELNYRKHGVVTLTRSNENLFLQFDNAKNPDYEFKKEFIDNFKKSIKILGDTNGFFDGEITLHTSTDYARNNREMLICRDYKDRENDTYSVYEYGVNTTEIKRVGKKALVNIFTDKVNELIDKYDN